MPGFLADLRLAARTLFKQPKFTVVAALTLALGIGSVTAIFSVVNGVLLKPLPYAEPDRLVNLFSNAAGLSLNQFPLSPDIYGFLKREARSYDEMTLFQRREASLAERGNPEVVPAIVTAFTYFGTFGVAAARGSVFGAAHDAPGAPLAVVISDRLWQRRFGADPSAVGRVVQLDGDPATILGVLPHALDENGSPDIWIPARLNQTQLPTGNFGWSVSARLKPGVTVAAAEAEAAPLIRRLMDGIQGNDYRAFLTQGQYRILVHQMREDVVGSLRRPLWILLGTVGFILLIACANVANLFLVRAEARQREVAVRSALGATRARLVGGQLAEAVVLAAIGGGAGVLLAALAVPALVRAAPATIPRLNAVRLDPLVLLVALGATVFAALLFGIVPAFRYTRRAAMGALRQGGRGATADRVRLQGRRVLVVIQTAMTLILLVGSGLLLRSFASMLNTDLGFRPANVLTLRVALPRASYPDATRVVDFETRLVEKLGAMPGVDAAGAASSVPMSGNPSGTAFVIDGQPTPAGQLPPLIRYKYTAPGYFETMGMRVIYGRSFDRRDLAAGSRDIIINKVMADQFWPGTDPVGKRIRPSGAQAAPDGTFPWFTVVGVVESERQDGLRNEIRMLLYCGLASPLDGGQGARTLTYVMRGPNVTRDRAAARAAVWALDPQLPVAAERSMDEIVSLSIVPFTFTMLTLGIAAAMALTLGMIGLYGVLSYAVTLRVREIGVRLALGAQPAVILRSIVGQGLAIVAVGLLAGIAGAFALTWVLKDLLFGTEALDITTFAGMTMALLVVAVLASYVPARRAASVSPMESLRD
jgi:predicted permease